MIKKIVVGELEENCYIFEYEDKCLIIDPGDEFERIKNNINKKVSGILVTHYHFDHIGALEECKNYYHIDKENDFSKIDYNIEVIETPGHTNDSKTFYFKEDKIMFTGDFIFKGTMGRMDLPTGSVIDMINSLKKMEKYSKDIILYPGHGEETILEKEIPSLLRYFE